MKRNLLILLILVTFERNYCRAGQAADESLLCARMSVYEKRLEQVENAAQAGSPWFFISKDQGIEECLIRGGKFKRLKPAAEFNLDVKGNWVWTKNAEIRGYSLTIRDVHRNDEILKCRLIQHGGGLSEVIFQATLKEENGIWRVLLFEVDRSTSS